MDNIIDFYISNNSLTTLPENLFNRKYIGMIVVDGNQLTNLPHTCGSVATTLRYLAVARNNLTKFPTSCQLLKKVELLDARNNSFAELPSWFDQLESLNYLVSGNPLCYNGWVDGSDSAKVNELIRNAKDQGCLRQCSDMCLDIYLENGAYHACNVPNCNYRTISNASLCRKGDIGRILIHEPFVHLLYKNVLYTRIK